MQKLACTLACLLCIVVGQGARAQKRCVVTDNFLRRHGSSTSIHKHLLWPQLASLLLRMPYIPSSTQNLRYRPNCVPAAIQVRMFFAQFRRDTTPREYILEEFKPNPDKKLRHQDPLTRKVAKLKTLVFEPSLVPPMSMEQANRFREAMGNKASIIVAIAKGNLAAQISESGDNSGEPDNDGEPVVGAADLRLVPIDDGRLAGYITNVCVNPNARRMGIARKLMEFGEVRARELGVHTLVLHVKPSNTAASGLYFDIGYEELVHGNVDPPIHKVFSSAEFTDASEYPPELILTKRLDSQKDEESFDDEFGYHAARSRDYGHTNAFDIGCWVQAREDICVSSGFGTAVAVRAGTEGRVVRPDEQCTREGLVRVEWDRREDGDSSYIRTFPIYLEKISY